MELMPNFTLLRPATVDEAVAMWAEHADARYLAGGTDLLVNTRRGIEQPAALIALDRIAEIGGIAETDDGLRIGAGVLLTTLAGDQRVRRDYAAVAEAAAEVAGPTHRAYATLGGNLCLDTRCIYYNQSEWWRKSNDYCLKHRGSVCHVAPGGKRCFAAFSGDVAPAMLVHDAEVELAGPSGRRRVPLADIYRNDGMDHLALEDGELLVAAVLPKATAGLPSGYAKSRVRGSIDFPLAGVAVCLRPANDGGKDIRVGLTGVSPRPIAVTGLDAIAAAVPEPAGLDGVRDKVQSQAKAMKTTVTPPHYRRRVAGALARKLVERLTG
jgi:4-hydroxybenzoyl-CoA reductase subunit beta